MNLIWHYAPWMRLPEILQARELRASNAGTPGLMPMIWFSARQDWEPTATKMVADEQGVARRMSFSEQRRRFGCIRFGVASDDARLLPWAQACKAAGASFTQRRKMESEGRRLGANPADWFAIAGSIPIVGMRFQVFVEQWGDADVTEMARAWTMMRGG